MRSRKYFHSPRAIKKKEFVTQSSPSANLLSSRESITIIRSLWIWEIAFELLSRYYKKDPVNECCTNDNERHRIIIIEFLHLHSVLRAHDETPLADSKQQTRPADSLVEFSIRCLHFNAMRRRKEHLPKDYVDLSTSLRGMSHCSFISLCLEQ